MHAANEFSYSSRKKLNEVLLQFQYAMKMLEIEIHCSSILLQIWKFDLLKAIFTKQSKNMLEIQFLPIIGDLSQFIHPTE